MVSLCKLENNTLSGKSCFPLAPRPRQQECTASCTAWPAEGGARFPPSGSLSTSQVRSQPHLCSIYHRPTADLQMHLYDRGVFWQMASMWQLSVPSHSSTSSRGRRDVLRPSLGASQGVSWKVVPRGKIPSPLQQTAASRSRWPPHTSLISEWADPVISGIQKNPHSPQKYLIHNDSWEIIIWNTTLWFKNKNPWTG